MRIELTDNNFGLSSAGNFPRKEVASLFPIADKTIGELCKENENLLIFPYCYEATDDKIGDSTVISIQNTADSETVRLCTGNIMGFIGVGDLRLKIKSRFDSGREDFFLHYMLQKVMSFNLFDLNHDSNQDEVFDFAMFMFPYFLKRALRQGIYREYKTYRHNDANVKGIVDVGRHVARNVPFVGNIAYSTRDYSCDNSMTELIRHTIEFMKTRKFGQAVLNIDCETVENVNAIVEHTPLYCKGDRNNVVSRNLRMKAHPYYTEYHPLQTLCLQILRMEEIKYGENDEEMCGILFDGAWLWEEYVNTILGRYGFVHPENRLGKGAIYLFEDKSGIRYPDFYKDDIVLDAKYKRIGSYDKVSKVDPDDIHQIMAYLSTLGASRGGFVAPLIQQQDVVPTSKLVNRQASLSIFGIEISATSESYGEFCRQMEKKEQIFVESLCL